MKSVFLHARRDQKIDQEPNFHEPRSSNGGYYREQPKWLILTLDHMGTPLKNQNFKNKASSCLSWPKLGLEPKNHEAGTSWQHEAWRR